MLKLEKLIGEVITIKSINGDEIVAVLIGESDRDKVITVTNPKQVLINNSEVVYFKNKKIKTKNTHGTGCTLSSAIAMFLSCGKPLKKSCELGIKYVNQAIKSNLMYGKGHGPINHLNSFKLNRKFL